MSSITFFEGWLRSIVSLGTPALLCSQHAQSFIEKHPVRRISWVFKSSAAWGQIQEKQSTYAYRIPMPTAVFPTLLFDLLYPETFFYCSWDVFLLFFIFMGHVKQNPFCCFASNAWPKRIFISFIVILLDFSEPKFIRGTSVIAILLSRYMIAKAIAIRHNRQKENIAFNKTLICD